MTLFHGNSGSVVVFFLAFIFICLSINNLVEEKRIEYRKLVKKVEIVSNRLEMSNLQEIKEYK